jgi:hypothetical protein
MLKYRNGLRTVVDYGTSIHGLSRFGLILPDPSITLLYHITPHTLSFEASLQKLGRTPAFRWSEFAPYTVRTFRCILQTEIRCLPQPDVSHWRISAGAGDTHGSAPYQTDTVYDVSGVYFPYLEHCRSVTLTR